MTGTAPPRVQGEQAAPPRARRPRGRHTATTAAVAVACGLLGFVLVTQFRAGETLGTQLEAEREEDLATILANLSAETDRLQSEFTDLRLTLLAFEESAERDELAVRNLERRLDDFSILAGVVAAEGEGIVLHIADPRGELGPEHMVDTVQELRDAGAEAIDVNGVRLVVSSSFSLRNNRLLVDGTPISPPFRVASIGPAETMARALAIPNGVIDTLERAGSDVAARVDTRSDLTVPARGDPAPFVFGEPVTEVAD